MRKKIKEKKPRHLYENYGFGIFLCDLYIRNEVWYIIFTYVQNIDVLRWNDRAHEYYTYYYYKAYYDRCNNSS